MDSQDWMGWYVCVAYAVFLIVCALGAFSRAYAANLLQRVALLIFAVYAAWRIELIIKFGWGYPHEALVATALLLHAGGSTIKTIRHIRAGKRFRRRSGDTITGDLHD